MKTLCERWQMSFEVLQAGIIRKSAKIYTTIFQKRLIGKFQEI